MEEKTIIQNIFGTVHGHVVGGNMTQADTPSDPAPDPVSGPVHQLPSREQLRANIKAAKQHKFKARLGMFFNLPSLFMLPLFGYLVFRLLGQIQFFRFDIQNIPRPGQVSMIELAVLGSVTMLLGVWMQSVRRKHTRTIEYAQHQIDQAELALQFHHH